MVELRGAAIVDEAKVLGVERTARRARWSRPSSLGGNDEPPRSTRYPRCSRSIPPPLTRETHDHGTILRASRSFRRPTPYARAAPLAPRRPIHHPQRASV